MIGDRAYDSDPLDQRLRQKHGIRLIAPHKYNRRRKSTQDGRELRRYCRRWKIERDPRSILGERIAEMLTATEPESLLETDVKTIYTYVKKGLIPYVRIQSNLRFIRKEILDWVDQQSFHTHPTDRERRRG